MQVGTRSRTTSPAARLGMARPSPHLQPLPLPSECVGAGEADRERRVPWDGGARGDRRMTQGRAIAIGPEAQLSSAHRHARRSRTWLNSPAPSERTDRAFFALRPATS
ncbi:hypothetical protein VTO73DRAFT_2985 [Trametes versicolor]